MQQISRPYQIALVVLVLAAATWFVAFGHHSSSGGSSPSSSSASSSPSQAGESASGSSGSSGSSSSPIYHGSAPGVEGLTKDIAKAHAAVGTSEANARQLAEKSAQATSTTPSEAGSATTTPAATAPASKHAAAASTPATAAGHTTTTHTTVTHVNTPAASHSSVTVTTVKVRAGAPAGQKAVEETVAKGKVALVLFWNPTGTNDHTVRTQVQAVAKSHLPVVVFEAHANEVALYGAITRQVPIYGTPTILIVGAKDATSLTGLQDAFSIEQAVREIHAG